MGYKIQRRLLRLRFARSGLRLGAPLSALILASGPAMAQQTAAPASAQPAALPEVVVTATKRSESLQKVPMSIQAFDTQKLGQLNIQDFSDYTALLPSVSIGAGGGGVVPGGSGNTRILMRGISADSSVNYAGTLPTVGTYLDDQPVSTITGAVDVQIYDVARVEALSGPQGTLYGASSEAGTLRIITNQPNPNHFAAGYDLQGDSVEHGGLGYTAEGYVNQPITQNVALRVVGWAVETGGYIDNIPATTTFPTSGACIANYSPAPAGCTTSANVAKHDFNTSDKYGGRAALKIDLNDSWTITPRIMGQETETHGTSSALAGLGRLQTERFYPDSTSDRWWDASLTVEGKISNFDITYVGAYMQRHDVFHTDYSNYSRAYDVLFGSGSLFTNNAGQVINPSQQLQEHIEYVHSSHELRVTSPKDQPIRVIAGLFTESQENDVNARFQVADLAQSSWVTGYPYTWWLSDYRRNDTDSAAFGEVAWDILPKLTLTGGVRFAQDKNALAGFAGTHDVYASEAATCFPLPSAPGIHAPCFNFAGEVKSTATTPKANLTYHFDSNRLIYFTYSKGFRPGGVNRGQDLPNYQPDYVTNYEVGWKTAWFGNRLRWNGAVYLEDWDNFQFGFLGANGLLIEANGGEAQIPGVESDVSWAVTRNFTVSGALSVMDPHTTKNYCGALSSSGAPITNCTTTPDPATGAVLQAPSGTQLPLTNKFKGNIQARYAWEAGPYNPYVQGVVVYQSSERADLRNSDNNLLGGDLPGFATADFTLGVKFQNLTTELYIKNLFDSHASINRYTQCPVTVCAAAGLDLVYNTPLVPRVIGLRLAQNF